jgi:hypothetical protein
LGTYRGCLAGLQPSHDGISFVAAERSKTERRRRGRERGRGVRRGVGKGGRVKESFNIHFPTLARYHNRSPVSWQTSFRARAHPHGKSGAGHTQQ